MECPTGLTLMGAVDEAALALRIADRAFAQELLEHHRKRCTVCANDKRDPDGGPQLLPECRELLESEQSHFAVVDICSNKLKVTACQRRKRDSNSN